MMSMKNQLNKKISERNLLYIPEAMTGDIMTPEREVCVIKGHCLLLLCDPDIAHEELIDALKLMLKKVERIMDE